MSRPEDSWESDAELHDENDPEYQVEIFKVFRMTGLNPEDLFVKEFADKYADWLKTLEDPVTAPADKPERSK